MKKIFVSILLIFVSVIPASAIKVKSVMQTLMESWVGENINTVIDRWGYPSDSKVVAGRNLYYWKKEAETMYNTIGNSTLAYGSKLTCSMIFETDANDIIIKGQYEGNNCPISYMGVRKYANPKNNPWEKTSIKIKTIKSK